MIFKNEDTFDYKILFSHNTFSNQITEYCIAGFFVGAIFCKILLCHLHPRKYNHKIIVSNCYRSSILKSQKKWYVYLQQHDPIYIECIVWVVYILFTTAYLELCGSLLDGAELLYIPASDREGEVRAVEDHQDQLYQGGGLEPQPALSHHLYRLLGLKDYIYIHMYCNSKTTYCTCTSFLTSLKISENLHPLTAHKPHR